MNKNDTHLQPPPGPRKRPSTEALQGSPLLKSPRLAPKDDERPKEGPIEVNNDLGDSVEGLGNPMKKLPILRKQKKDEWRKSKIKLRIRDLEGTE
ncbi:hypothetical protein QQZ08_011001 [Neonectria magnoliae]|uniref:Uncharacterized protein n=1 Tax=Neonectria magnoliae TaxID=2732573 RepID=A0ABR1HD62_9HYPO